MAAFEYDTWLESFIEAGDFAFQWDYWNRTKNSRKHGVAAEECEEAIRCGALPLGIQVHPPTDENRYAVLGESAGGKPLFVLFTVRKQKVRVISARVMTSEEREDYGLLR